MNLKDYTDTLLLAGAIIGGIVYIFIFTKRGMNKAEKESNDILRKLVDDQRLDIAKLTEGQKLIKDQKVEILKLRERMHDLGNDMQELQLKFERLSSERKQLTQLITLALSEHFASNPETVKAAEALVTIGKEKTE